MPLTPIVSSINSPCYNLAKHLVDILTPLSGKGSSHTKNSQHFVERARELTIEPGNLLVSFHVVSASACSSKYLRTFPNFLAHMQHHQHKIGFIMEFCGNHETGIAATLIDVI